jgi:hypothetical protein
MSSRPTPRRRPRAQAEELGLDRFHEAVAIGLLEAVDVSVRASPAAG